MWRATQGAGQVTEAQVTETKMRWLRKIGLLGGWVGVLGGGLALAQVTPVQTKPPVLAPAPVPGGKFAPGPAPDAVVPPQVDKFANPPVIPPPQAQAPGTRPPVDKFSAPPSVPPAVPPPAAPAPSAVAPPAVPGLPRTAVPAQPAPVPVPANEPPALGQLRTLLGPGATLTYGSVVVTNPATGAVRLADVLLRQPGEQIAAAELTLDGLRPDGIAGATAQGVTLTAKDGTVTLVGKVELRDLTVTRPTPRGPFRPDQVALGYLRVEALAVQGARPVAITEAVVQDYLPGRVGRVTFAGLDVLVPEAGVLDRVRIGRVALEGVALHAVLTALAAGDVPPRPNTDYSLAVEGVTVTQGDAQVGTLGALRMAGVQGQGRPDTGRLTLEGLRVEPFPLIEGWLRKLGYAALTGDLSAETRFDAAAGRLELIGFLFGIRDAAAMGLSVTLEGVGAEAAARMDFQDAKLAAFGLRYLDQSLMGRLAAAEAATTRRTERQIRDGWANQAAGALGGGGAVTPVLSAVQRLLRGQATEVTITAAPPKPVPVSELPPLALGGAPAMQRALGITATAR